MAKTNNAVAANVETVSLDTSDNIPALVAVGNDAPKSSGNMFADFNNVTASANALAIAEKMTKLATAKQNLAEACDLFSEGKAKNSEASEVANRGALPLYEGRIAGLFTNAEISAALGDIFGYKPKQNGTPGKTPAGEGEALRKRIVRAVAASEYVTGANDGGKFFAGLPANEIEQVLVEVQNNKCSLFTAYERFADIKKEHTAKTDQAFSVKHIESLCESLAKPEAVSIIKANSELIAAYATLADIITAIGEAGAKLD